MIRRFNYTGRNRLERKDVQITTKQNTRGILSFDAEIQLQHYQFPGESKIYIEAYHRTNYKRFFFGFFSSLTPPVDRTLAEFTNSANLLFRVKIVDESKRNGRLLAVADRIPPQSPEDTENKRVCLLHVEYENLGQRIWQLELNEDWPLLRVNNSVDNIREIVRGDQNFFSLVYPAVTENILTEIIVNRSEDEVDPDDDTRWEALWLRFAINLTGPVPEADSDEEKRSWINRAVGAFCTYQRVLERFEQLQQ